MPKIYVTNKSGHDFSAAQSFGEIVYLSEGAQNRYAAAKMYRLFADILNDSSSDDYILPTGLTTMCMIAAAIFARIHGRLNLLLYKDGRYVERKLKMDELSNAIVLPPGTLSYTVVKKLIDAEPGTVIKMKKGEYSTVAMSEMHAAPKSTR
jgi:hypothetical protein